MKKRKVKQLSKRKLKEYVLKEAGADMIGIANIERFDNCPPEFHPRNLNKFTRSVIVVGLRIIRGAVRPLEQGTGRICYNAYGYGGINGNFMPHVLRKAACYIEDCGYEAVPSVQWTGMPPLEPIIDHRMAGVAAGLGEMGYSKVFLTEKFGPLQRLGILLTDAEIEPDPIRVNRICDKCKACIRGCPAGAISNDDIVRCNIDGYDFEYGRLDCFLCGIAHPGAHPSTTPYKPDGKFDISEEMALAKEKLKDVPIDDDIKRRGIAEEISVAIKTKYHHPIHTLVYAIGSSRAMCGARGCIRDCLAHLDRKGILKTKLNLDFREKGQQAAAPMHTYTEYASQAVTQRRQDEI